MNKRIQHRLSKQVGATCFARGIKDCWYCNKQLSKLRKRLTDETEEEFIERAWKEFFQLSESIRKFYDKYPTYNDLINRNKKE